MFRILYRIIVRPEITKKCQVKFYAETMQMDNSRLLKLIFSHYQIADSI